MSQGPVMQIQDTDDGIRHRQAVPAGELPPPVIDQPAPKAMMAPEASNDLRAPAPIAATNDTFDWGNLGLNPLRTTDEGGVQQASYEE
jgi:hypothetical protein